MKGERCCWDCSGESLLNVWSETSDRGGTERIVEGRGEWSSQSGGLEGAGRSRRLVAVVKDNVKEARVRHEEAAPAGDGLWTPLKTSAREEEVWSLLPVEERSIT